MNYLNKFGTEKAEGDAMEDWAIAVIKVSCLLIIGVIVINSVVDTASIDENSTFYDVFNNVTTNTTSGYTLAGLLVLVIGAAAIMRFLGFM